MTKMKTILLVLMALVSVAWANKSQIGYLYPAGGQQGTVVQVTAGGQFLRGANRVIISGEGVTAKVVKQMRGTTNLSGDQRRELQRQLKELREKRIAELPAPIRAEIMGANKRSPKRKPPARKAADKKTPASKTDAAKDKDAKDTKTEEKPPVKLPNHPLLEDLEEKSLRELAHIADQMFMPRSKLQQNRQLAEAVLLEITIDADAEPGFRELRIQTRDGLTSPLVFHVSTLPERYELEPNDTSAYEKIRDLPNLPRPKPIQLPAVLNGQIRPGDVDRFRFYAKKGQKLVIQTHARSLIPYLADAVPGWFQATVTLYTASGTEVAFADDFRFDPDPVMYYEITRDGGYELEIRDSIYRGREDFVYRVAVGELPFITQMFPLGARENAKVSATIDGWNLDTQQIPLTTDTIGIRKAACMVGGHASNAVPFAVSEGAECLEKESNNDTKTAQAVTLPMIVNGRIDTAGDMDVFRFTAKAGDEICAEVFARRLNSPLDALLRITDASGKVVAWNDDYVVKDVHLHKDIVGLTTHHADSFVTAKLPKAGTYYVQLADTQRHGGDAFAYRLHIGPKQPDFALRMTPSSLMMPAGSVVPVTMHVLRKNGYDGPINVSLKNAPAGFKLNGGTIPAGCDRIGMTLQSPPKPLGKPVELKLLGTVDTVTRPVIAADDRMQAFLYRHLVPSEKLIAIVPKTRWRMPAVQVPTKPVKITPGGSAKVNIKAPKRGFYKELQLQVQQGPKGLAVEGVKAIPDGFVITLKADKEAAASATNVILETIREYIPKDKNGKVTGKKRRDPMGVISAFPVEIVAADSPVKATAQTAGRGKS